MTKEEIKKGIDEMEVYAPVTAIERDLDMPFSTLQKALSGTRSLPQKWHKPLRKYFLSKRDKEAIEDEKLSKELKKDPEMTEIMQEIVTAIPAKNGKEKKSKKTTFKVDIVLPQSKVVELNNLTTPSKGKTKDLNEKKVTNYPINTKGGGKKESAYIASRRKLKNNQND
jgi:hypothetical protein